MMWPVRSAFLNLRSDVSALPTSRGSVLRSSPLRRRWLHLKIVSIVIIGACVLDLAIALALGIHDLVPAPVVLAIRTLTSQLKQLPVGLTMTLMFSWAVLFICLPFHVARLVLGRSAHWKKESAKLLGTPGAEPGGVIALKRSRRRNPTPLIQRLATVQLIRSVR